LIEEGSEAFRSVLEKLFNAAMRLEREEFLRAKPYERTPERRGWANGYKSKRVRSRVGELKVEIPQVRGLSFYPRSLEKGCRSEKALKLAIAEMYVQGVSTRRVSQITEQLCGTEISASQVSRIAQLLDEQLTVFRERELGSYLILYLDAHYEKVRVEGQIRDLAILKAVGVTPFGTREVLGLSAELSEAEIHWRQFLESLQKRGLRGVVVIVSDDHAGLRAARQAVFPSVPWQRCQFHLAQNAQRLALSRRQRYQIAQDVRDIFNSASLQDAESMLQRKVKIYQDSNTALADWMENNLSEGFTVFAFPRSAHRRLRTINGLENLNKQIRRRTRVVGIFPNKASAIRLISAVLAEIHEEWLTGRQYLNLRRRTIETESPVSDQKYRKTVA
jgi:transposase-like protein